MKVFSRGCHSASPHELGTKQAFIFRDIGVHKVMKFLKLKT